YSTIAGIGSADSGLCARLTFAASAPQNWPTERNRISLARKNQPSAPGITAARSLSAERDLAASSSTNFCCALDSGIQSPAKTFGIDNDVRIAAYTQQIRKRVTAFPAVCADSASIRQTPGVPAKIRIDFKGSFSITVLRKKAPNIERGI